MVIPILLCPKLYKCSTFLISDDAGKKEIRSVY